ncbi:immunoglobulin lambda-1 light chain-like [Ambystoma mexicanum]|uniref:immunoglobulin lambda-1 light chain-like n=1 Tax=Ambystoma mexicanum TaxID=8296 RepID=UPI0037E997C8
MDYTWCFFVLALQFADAEARAPPSLIQPLPSITTAGKHPTITCSMKGSSVTDHVLSWYKQPTNQRLTFLVSHRDGAKPAYGEGVSERFLPGIDKDSKMFTLTIGNTDRSDEGTYYCAIWYSNQYIFGDGTQVIYRDTMELKKPRVHLFDPSPEEILRQARATVVCVANDFLPGIIRIKWLVDGYQNDTICDEFPPVKNKDGTFKQVGSITLEAETWEKGAEVLCLVEHESGAQSVKTKGRAVTRKNKPGCTQDTPPEELTSFGNATSGKDSALVARNGVLRVAFYVYLSALCASCVYGLAVAFCLLKRRMDERKRRAAFSSHGPPSQGARGRARRQGVK